MRESLLTRDRDLQHEGNSPSQAEAESHEQSVDQSESGKNNSKDQDIRCR